MAFSYHPEAKDLQRHVHSQDLSYELQPLHVT